MKEHIAAAHDQRFSQPIISMDNFIDSNVILEPFYYERYVRIPTVVV
jgi:hypothetical protein